MRSQTLTAIQSLTNLKITGITRDTFEIGIYCDDQSANGATNYTAEMVKVLEAQNLRLIQFRSKDDAIAAVQRKGVALALVFDANFSANVQHMVKHIMSMCMITQIKDFVHIVTDDTNAAKYILHVKLSKAALSFAEHLAERNLRIPSNCLLDVYRAYSMAHKNALVTDTLIRDDFVIALLTNFHLMAAGFSAILLTLNEISQGIRARERTSGVHFILHVLGLLFHELLFSAVRCTVCQLAACAILDRKLQLMHLVIIAIYQASSLIGSLLGINSKLCHYFE